MRKSIIFTLILSLVMVVFLSTPLLSAVEPLSLTQPMEESSSGLSITYQIEYIGTDLHGFLKFYKLTATAVGGCGNYTFSWSPGVVAGSDNTVNPDVAFVVTHYDTPFRATVTVTSCGQTASFSRRVNRGTFFPIPIDNR